ncbi:MAG: hypothetical protein ACRD1H_15155, partial [Vicinamibacterales bacterium]
PYAMLERDGIRPKTSRHPGRLTCDLRVDGVPAEATSGERLHVIAHAVNTGDTTWDARPARRGGFVTIGCKLVAADGHVLNDTLGRTFLPHDVHPGGALSVPMSIALPSGLMTGHYRLLFDLIDEQICWFSDTSPGTACSATLVIT